MQPCYDHSNTFDSWELMTQLHHDWADAIVSCKLVLYRKLQNKHTRVIGGWDVTGKSGTEPQRQTCILHLTRSRGTTAVCVVPQLRIPPNPHRTKYFWEPNSQLSPSEETSGIVRTSEPAQGEMSTCVSWLTAEDSQEYWQIKHVTLKPDGHASTAKSCSYALSSGEACLPVETQNKDKRAAYHLLFL